MACAVRMLKIIRMTFKNILCIALASASAATLYGRFSSDEMPAEYGIEPGPEKWYQINPHTWNTFTSFDGDIIFGAGKERFTMIGVEYYSTGVIEGRKVGDSTLVASFQDRGAFFGGDGYMDISYFAPVDSKYAQQATALGGWKYNITKYVDIDLGGNIIYSTKKVIGPGIAGYGGESWRGDFYVGFTSDELYVRPFAYFDYDMTYDATKWLAGFNPIIDLEPLTAIENLRIESQLTFGYVNANRWSGDQKINGNYMRNSYGYIQIEANLVYQIGGVRMFVGVGWAMHNDGRVASNGVDLGPDNMVWTSCGIGYIF